MKQEFAVDITNLVERWGSRYTIEASQLGANLDRKYRVHGTVFTYATTVKDADGDVQYWEYRSVNQYLKIFND